MKTTLIYTAVLAALAFSSGAFAQASLNIPLPPGGVAPAPAAVAPGNLPSTVVNVNTPTPKGPAGNVDKVLERIARNMQPQADMIDQQAEASINRDVNLSRSTGQLLRPIGYFQVGDERAIFASEDGVRVMKLKENSRIGVMQIAKISEDGVEYKVSGKNMYAPIAYTASEAPKVSNMATPVTSSQQGTQSQSSGQQSFGSMSQSGGGVNGR